MGRGKRRPGSKSKLKKAFMEIFFGIKGKFAALHSKKAASARRAGLGFGIAAGGRGVYSKKTWLTSFKWPFGGAVLEWEGENAGQVPKVSCKRLSG